MLDLKNVTLISVTSVNIDNTIKALLHSSKKINFASIKLVTHEKPINLPNKINYNKINKITSVNDYSYKMIYNLEDYIETDYALIVQADGFVINPFKWREDFLNYDYIGSPFKLPSDDFSYRDSKNNIFRVGNGGFSLRSKNLISLPNKLGLEWKSFNGYYNEDGFICGMYRHIYEDNKLKFAPLDIAKYFSHEKYIPELENIIPFGFHGEEHLHKIKYE
jgi:hypothetical protein